jgi:hypothetical protein
LSQQPSDFNGENKELRTLMNINDVDGRFILSAAKYWWAYRIAFEFKISPKEVKTWDAEEIMEALAAIGLASRNKPKQP